MIKGPGRGSKATYVRMLECHVSEPCLLCQAFGFAQRWLAHVDAPKSRLRIAAGHDAGLSTNPTSHFQNLLALTINRIAVQ